METGGIGRRREGACVDVSVSVYFFQRRGADIPQRVWRQRQYLEWPDLPFNCISQLLETTTPSHLNVSFDGKKK